MTTLASVQTHVLWRRPTGKGRWQAAFTGSKEACSQEEARVIRLGGGGDFYVAPAGKVPWAKLVGR